MDANLDVRIKEDKWYKVFGTVVGYLHDNDENEAQEHELMIVKVESIDGRPAHFRDLRPLFLLRWVGHDWEPAPENFSNRHMVENGLLVGLRITFSTSAEEQEDYTRGWVKT